VDALPDIAGDPSEHLCEPGHLLFGDSS